MLVAKNIAIVGALGEPTAQHSMWDPFNFILGSHERAHSTTLGVRYQQNRAKSSRRSEYRRIYDRLVCQTLQGLRDPRGSMTWDPTSARTWDPRRPLGKWWSLCERRTPFRSICTLWPFTFHSSSSSSQFPSLCQGLTEILQELQLRQRTEEWKC